jgi:cobalt-zinc-cadmium efflux system membrane fusion protein
MTNKFPRRVALFRAVHVQVALLGVLALTGIVIWLTAGRGDKGADNGDQEFSSQLKRPKGIFHPTAAQWAMFTVEPVQQREFRSEFKTEGKIGLDEDRSTPIFSPYVGRVTKLLAKPGDTVTVGQPLFMVEATDMVQAQNDFIAAVTGLNKSRSALNLAQINDKRQRLLYDAKAVPLKEVQNARATLDAAENDVRSSEVALEAVRNRLRILGKTDPEIAEFQAKGTINPSTPIYTPIGGTIVQRKVGPGQYIGSGATDPVFVIGDLSTVWLIAYVRESEAPKVGIGQRIKFTVLADPERVNEATVVYAAAILDASTRRLLVRATIDNSEGRFKPEMFANVSVVAGEGITAPAVPRHAVMYEGDTARIRVVRDDGTIELRRIKTGLTTGGMIEIVDGLRVGEKIITKGSLFIDRVAAADRRVLQ